MTTTRLRAAALIALALISVLLLGCAKTSGEASPETTPTAASSPQARIDMARAPASAVTSTPTSQPDRTSCTEIRGTAYRSTTVQAFYLSNCLPTPTPSTPTPAAVAVALPPTIPGSEVPGARWILVDIASQTAMAMIGESVIHTAQVTTGKEGWETPRGTFQILYRVANETMTSNSIGAEEDYVLENVLYTQYFTNVGHALHLNYWRADSYFGNIPSSHGCVGMRLADAEFFWRFATNGTRVTII